MAYNKIIYGNNTLIDLTSDSVEASKLLSGYTAHDRSGAVITGTCNYDANTQNATAGVAEVLVGQTFYAQGVEKTGTMPNRGGDTVVIMNVSDQMPIEQGYHDGSGYAEIDPVEQAKIIDSNIKAGVEILGVTGTYGGETVSAQAKTATPSTSQQTILPDTGYDYLSQVTVNAIPYTEVLNSAGGYTVTIG